METSRRIRFELDSLYYLLILASICAMLGPWVPVLELAEHFALQYVIGAAVLGFWAWWLGRKVKLALCLMLLAYHGYSIIAVTAVSQPDSAPASAELFSILQFNALYRNNDARALAAIEAADADVIVIQEYPANKLFNNAQVLNARYPYQHRPRYATVFFEGTAVFSKHPFTLEGLHEGGLEDYAGLWRLEFASQLVIYAVHSPTPTPPDVAIQRDRQHRWLARLMRDETLPAVALGDFNQTPYVRNFRALLADNRLHLAPFPDSVLPTWPRFFYLPVLQVPIDLLLANAKTQVLSRKRVNIAGSDHMAVLNVLQVEAAP